MFDDDGLIGDDGLIREVGDCDPDAHVDRFVASSSLVRASSSRTGIVRATATITLASLALGCGGGDAGGEVDGGEVGGGEVGGGEVDGGGADGSDVASDTTSTSSTLDPSTSTTTATTTTSPASTPATTTSPTSTPATSTSATSTTTTRPPPPPPAPDLVEAAPAVLEATSAVAAGAPHDPAEVARAVTGLTIDFEPPDGSALSALDVRLFGIGAGSEVSWGYDVIPPEPVGEIDITLDDNGQGAVATLERWTPIMATAGFGTQNGIVGSDPGEPGGPNSVNFVFLPDAAAAVEVVNGVDIEWRVARVWADEEIVGFEEPDPISGYRFDALAIAPPDEIPVPLLVAWRAEVPVPDGTVLADASVRTDFSDFDPGLVELRITVERPAGSFVDTIAFFESREWNARLQPGDTFFGEVTPRDPVVVDTRWTQAVVLANTWEGSITVEARDVEDPGGVVEITYEIDLSPSAETVPGPDPGPVPSPGDG